VLSRGIDGRHKSSGRGAHFGPLRANHEPTDVLGIAHCNLPQLLALVRSELEDQPACVGYLAQPAQKLQILGCRGAKVAAGEAW